MRMGGETSSRRRILLLGGIAALLIAFLVLRSRLPEPNLQELVEDIARILGHWTYLVVAVLAYLETGAFIGLVAPGEVAVILGGAVAGQGEISLVVMLGIAWAAAYLGDTTGFLIGRRTGRGFLLRHGRIIGLTPERFGQVEQYFARHGGKTILIGRFISLVRPLAPFIASSSGMRYRDFAPYSVLGTGLWAVGFTLLGYFASRSLDRAADLVGQGSVLFGVVVGVIAGVVLAAHFLREPENRHRLVAGMERRRALRPLVRLGRRLSPAGRFAWARVTPGRLGLELTTLLAVLAVGLYLVVGYTIVLSDDPGPTPGDMGALDLSRDLRTGWLTDVMRQVTKLGSSAVTVPIAGVAALMLGWRRRWTELVVLVAGLVIAHIAVADIKHALDRPRPPDPIDAADAPGFPSGHAAYSVLYLWLAITVVVRISPGLAIRSVIVAVGFAIAALVGLSRVYLGVHYLSDVTAGWALGLSAFALCAVIALVATHLRQNAPRNVASGEDRA